MITALVEAKLLVVTVALGVVLTLAAFNAVRASGQSYARTGELNAAQWASIQTAQLCAAAEGEWAAGTSSCSAPG